MEQQKGQKALVIAPQPFYKPRGTPFSVYYRTLVVAGESVSIDLLTYGEGDDVDIPGVRIIRVPRFARLGSVPIGPSALKMFLDIFVFFKAIGLLLRNRYDFVHAHEEAIFFCTFLKPLFRFKLVYDMHSSLPQQLTNFQFTRSKMLIGLFKWLEDRAIRKADAVITICPDLADYVLGRGNNEDKHFLIENSIFDPVRLKGQDGPAGEAADTEDLPAGKRYVVYAGTLERYQGIDILIRAFKSVIARSPDAFLLIAGGTKEQVATYRALAKDEQMDQNSMIIERVPQSTARRYCELASVQMSPRSAGTNTPLKTYEQIASGIPLVATRIHSHTQVLDDDVAYLVDPTPEALADGIVQALQDGKENNPKALNARKLYDEKYSRPVYEGKIRQLLGHLTTCAE